MGIRMSGLSSGLDTESIVGALMSAQSLKKTKVENAKTKLEWKETKWKDLNSKLYKLYNEQTSKMRLQSSYMTKKATISDESVASVKASTSAANGSYTMEVKNIATAQYLTGAKISATSTSEKLTDIDANLLNKEITIDAEGKTKTFTVTSDSTIQDFVDALKDAGLNANYDTTQKRFFISGKETGLDNAFSISTGAVSTSELEASTALKEAVGYDNLSSDHKAIVDAAMETLRTSGTDTDEYNDALEDIAQAMADDAATKAEASATTYVKAKLYGENYDSNLSAAMESVKGDYFTDEATSSGISTEYGYVSEDKVTEYGNAYDALTDPEQTREEYIQEQAIAAYETAYKAKADSDTTTYVNDQVANNEDVQSQIDVAAYSGVSDAEVQALSSEALSKYYGTTDASSVSGFEGTEGKDADSLKAQIASAVSAYASVEDRSDSVSVGTLSSLGLADVAVDSDGKVTVNGGTTDASTNSSIPSGMAFIAASDSKIILNGAELTSSTATVSANGLSIDLTSTTDKGETVSFSVTNDIDSVYDSIKTFFTEYNSVIKEMYTDYNAESARDYNPLTKEEKEAMTDDDVKLWEDKIKNSLLRGDTTLNSIMNSMKSTMQTQVEYDGKKYSLASFGIMTSTDYTDAGQYHIYGDSSDAVYADKTDKLRAALEEDPEAVINVLTGVIGKLNTVMSDKMKSSSVSSAMTFYNDKKITSDLKNYKSEISDWEDKLASMEDAYYAKFTAMETAMAKLQAQQSSLGGLLGS